jgi:sugar (pentulose or hexulose) kinase
MLEAMDAYGNVKKLIFFGGGANSPLWCQLIADITGMDISVTENPEAAGAGAAMLAAQAAGAKLEPLSIGRVYKSAGGYEEKYQQYRALEFRLWK